MRRELGAAAKAAAIIAVLLVLFVWAIQGPAGDLVIRYLDQAATACERAAQHLQNDAAR